jgi:hypothetical protein
MCCVLEKDSKKDWRIQCDERAAERKIKAQVEQRELSDGMFMEDYVDNLREHHIVLQSKSCSFWLLPRWLCCPCLPLRCQSLDGGLLSRTTAFLAKLCFLLNIKGGDYNRLLGRTTTLLRERLGFLLALSLDFFISLLSLDLSLSFVIRVRVGGTLFALLDSTLLRSGFGLWRCGGAVSGNLLAENLVPADAGDVGGLVAYLGGQLTTDASEANLMTQTILLIPSSSNLDLGRGYNA